MSIDNINLLPPEYRKKPITVRKMVLIITALLLLIPIIKYGFIRPVSIKNQKETLLSNLREEIEDSNDLDAGYAEDISKLEQLEQRLMELNEINIGNPLYWKNVLLEIIKDLPGNSGIDSFKCDSSSILISGTSPSDKESAEYMRRLKRSGYFSDVYVEKITYKYNREVNFYIRCNLDQEAMRRKTE